MFILQRNFLEHKTFISKWTRIWRIFKSLENKPDIICVEYWLKPELDIVIAGYDSTRGDR